jgi:hypothetical protein
MIAGVMMKRMKRWNVYGVFGGEDDSDDEW